MLVVQCCVDACLLAEFWPLLLLLSSPTFNSLRMDISTVDSYLCCLAEPNTVSVFKKSQNPTPAVSVKASFAPLANTHPNHTPCPHPIHTTFIHTQVLVRVVIAPPPLSPLPSPPHHSSPLPSSPTSLGQTRRHQLKTLRCSQLIVHIQRVYLYLVPYMHALVLVLVCVYMYRVNAYICTSA